MYAEKLAKAKELTGAALAILKNENAPQEERNKVASMMEDAKRLRAEAEELKEIEALHTELSQNAANSPAPRDGRANPPSEDFKTWGAFLSAIYASNTGRRHDGRLKSFTDTSPEDRKDLSEQVGATGGFLVPAEFQATLMSVMGEQSLIRPRATKIRMTRRQLDIPVLDQTGTTEGTPHWFGGMKAFWQEEASAKTASDPSFRLISLVAHKLIMYTRASDELLDDSAIPLQDFLSGPLGFAGAIAWYEDFAFLRGTGAGMPLGILNSPATLTVNRIDQNNVTYDDLVGMMEKFIPSGQGLWIMSQSVLPRLMLMNGPTGNPSYLWGNAVNGAPGTLLGYPYIVTEKLPRMSNTSDGDIILIDPKYYVVGDRQATTVESTKFDRWQYDQTSWRAVHRVDGQPWLSAPITYSDGNTQISPFVKLGAKST